jgi:ABC-type uncharacterized transport system involved in gliding motility auxiliary subunit
MSAPSQSTPAQENAARRRTRSRVYLVANAALLTSIVLMLNYLAFRHYERWDWTAHSIFTLSDRSERVLAQLSQPIEVWVLLSASEPEHVELRNLLERYRAATDRISLRYVDPHQDPGAYEEVVRRFRLGLAERETRDGVVLTSDVAVVVAAGERHWEIGRDDLVRQQAMPEDDEQRVELNVEAERALTGAIVQVTTGRPTKVCFTTGHGEASVGEGEAGLSELAAEMRRENLTHVTIPLREEIPDDCDALAVVGPTLAFDEGEADRIRQYVRGGGNLLVAVDPVLDPDNRRVVRTGLEDVMRDFGIRLDASVVVEPHPAFLPAGPGHPVVLYIAADFGEHELTTPFRGTGTGLLISEARSVRPIGETAHVLVRASDRSYSEIDVQNLITGDGQPGADAITGPASLAVATRVEVLGEAAPRETDEGAEPPTPRGGRVVVLGDATMLTSELLGHPSVSNRAFAGAALGWLTEREALISIPPRTVSRPGLPTEDDVMNLFFRVVVLIPLAFVFLGIAVWWNRRL